MPVWDNFLGRLVWMVFKFSCKDTKADVSDHRRSANVYTHTGISATEIIHLSSNFYRIDYSLLLLTLLGLNL